jgi:competence protein ComEC
MALPSGIAFWLGTLLLHQCRVLPGGWLMLGTGIAAAAMVVYWYRTRVVLAAWAATLLVGMCWAFIVAEQRLQWELPLALERQDIPVTGHITSLPEWQAGGQRFVMQTRQIDGQAAVTRILLTWYGQNIPDLRIGDEWRFTVRLKRPHGFANPGGFDRETWLFQQGIRATGYVRAGQPYQVVNHPAWQSPTGRLRQWMAQQIERVLMGKPLLGFIQALVLGKRDNIEANQWRVLSLTGTSHLMAISGLHISLIAGLGFALAHWGWRRYARGCLWIPAVRLGAWTGLAMATVYAALAGFAIPTQRALMMVAVLMLVHGGVRQTSSTQGLGLALWAVLLYDPLAALAVGFYLSFAAVGLIFYVMMGQTTQRLTWWRTLRLQWWVSIGLLPLTLYFFQQTPWLSFFANIWAIPWVSFIVAPLSLAGSAMVAWPIGEWLLILAHASVSLLWWGLERLAHDSLSQWFAPPPGLWGCLVMLAGLLLLGLPKGMPLRWVGWFWLAPVLAWPVNLLPAGVARLTVLDVGQGLAALVQTRHHTLLFDTGPKWGEGGDAGQSVIAPFLQHQGVRRLDRVIISHGHYDHVGGLHSLLQQIAVEDIWSSEPEQFIQLSMRHCVAGQQWQWDGVTFRVLYPDRVDYPRGNDNSCVLRVDAGDQAILLTGDIERRAEQRLVESAGDELAAQVMVAPHHGSKTSSTADFVMAVQPRYVLLPLGYLNRFGFPHPEVVARYQKLGAKWFATGYHGALTITIGATDELPPPIQYRLQHARYWYNDSHKRDYWRKN